MKKRLEAELISIAHRILKLKNKSDVDQLYKETQKLYETLAVLKFYQDNFETVKSELSEAVLEEKLESNVVELSPEPTAKETEDVVEAVAAAEPETESNVGRQEEQAQEAEPETEEEEETEATEEVVSEEPEAAVEPELEEEPTQEETSKEEPASEEPEEKEMEEEEPVAEEKPAFEPIFELEAEEEEEEHPEEKLEDHIGKYADPVFVKPDEVTLFPAEIPAETRDEIKAAIPVEAPKPVHECLSKSIAIGLNDRIGFVQHLFNDSNEDFNRVISQLNTFDTFEEAKTFINEMVIPDYNYWVGEEDYIERFMAIVEKKFQ
jgi:flagellar biosynthesis GTPase FlhF